MSLYLARSSNIQTEYKDKWKCVDILLTDFIVMKLSQIVWFTNLSVEVSVFEGHRLLDSIFYLKGIDYKQNNWMDYDLIFCKQ